MDKSLTHAIEDFTNAISGHDAPAYIVAGSIEYEAAKRLSSAVIGLPIEHISRWPQPSVCSKTILVNRVGQCLLGLRANFLENGGTWGFPAGFLNPGETPEEAARRELLEESGIELHRLPDVPDALRSFWYSDKTTERRWVIENTWVVLHDGFQPRPTKEMTAWQWVSPVDMLEMLKVGDIALLESHSVELAVSKSRNVAPHMWLGVGQDDFN